MAELELSLESPAERSTDWFGLPVALWILAGAMLVVRSAEVFYVPIMPLYARMLDVGVPLVVIGLVTSGGFGHTLQKPIAYGYLPVQYAMPGSRLAIEVAARRYEARVEKEPLYDPEDRKIKS